MIGVEAALSKKAGDPVVLDISRTSSFADLFVICHGTSDRQVGAIADAVESALRDAGQRPLAIEGASHGLWVLIDYGNVVFHVFLEERRRYYSLERLWGDAPNLTREFVPARPGRSIG